MITIKRIVIYEQHLGYNVAEFEGCFNFDDRKLVRDYCRALCSASTDSFVNSIGVIIECDDRHFRLCLSEFVTLLDFCL